MSSEVTNARERRRGRVRSAIVAEALAIMESEGFSGVTLRALAERIDYSPAALYRYFGSREDIIAAVANESLGMLAEQLRAAARRSSDDTASESVTAVGLAYLRFAAEEPVRFRLVFAEGVSARSSLGEPPGEGSPYGVVLALVRDAIAEGRVRADLDAEAAAFALWSLVHGMAVLEATHLREFDAEFARIHAHALAQLIAGWRACSGSEGRRDG